ncbi:MAG: universal stress protein, partial [Deltaproteobacteria bacterium]
RRLASEWTGLAAHPDPLDVLGLDLVQVATADHPVLAGLVHTAEDLGPDMLIVGTERRRGLERLLRASTAERLARTFQVGTLFIGEGMRALVRSDDGVLHLDRVVVPAGGTVSPQDAVDAALAFLAAIGRPDAALDLVTIGGSPEPPPLVVPPGQVLRWHGRPGGPVVPGLRQACDDLDADLVVMATRGHDSIVDDVAGTRTERLMRTVRCPLLAVPLPG